MTPRVVVAYGGSLETAAACAALLSRIGTELVTVTLDLGQGAELEQVRDQALAAGASRAHVVDARHELAVEVIRPALAAGAFNSSAHAVAITRPVIARHLVAVARMESATAVAHGAVGRDRERLERLIATLAPELAIHALVEEGIAFGGKAVAQHLWARVVTGASRADRRGAWYARTTAPAALAAHPAVVALTFERGVPVAVNGVPLELDALIEVIDTIAGDHGVGRLEETADAVDILTEAPAAVVLGAATSALAAEALPADLVARRAEVAADYAALIADGGWNAPTREMLDAFTDATADALTGLITLELAGGACRVTDCSTTSAATPAAACS